MSLNCNIPKIDTAMPTQLTNVTTKAASNSIKAVPIVYELNGLDALSFYNFCGIKKLIKYGNIQIEPITSEKEFDLAINSLKQTRDNIFIFGQCFTTPNASDKYLKALQAYCGEHDISKYINRYLATGEALPKMTVGNLDTGEIHSLEEKDLKQYIRIMEYALREVENTIPPYEGIVYRSGYFNPNGGQFWSSSKNIQGAVEHASCTEDFPVKFSVIKKAKGTDIQEINKDTRFKDEAEVLLHPNSEFIDVTSEISKDEYDSYYNGILKQILEILRRNLGIEDPKKAKELIGDLKIYCQK